MKNKNLITDIKQITPEWLTGILHDRGYITRGNVEDIKIKKSAETVESNVYFLKLIFSNDISSVNMPVDIVVKMQKEGNSLSKLLGRHEAKFYDIIAGAMKNQVVPECYYAEYSGTSRPFILLADMSATHTELYGELPSGRQRENAVDCLSKIHAFWWDSEKLKEFSKHSFVLYTFRENSFNDKDILSWFNKEKSMLEKFIQTFNTRIDDKRKTLYRAIYKLYPERAVKRLQDGNITVIHADPHFWNFFYPKESADENDNAFLSDWSLWSLGAGAQDLAYMIGIFCDTETRRRTEKDLIKRYHDNLVNSGVKNYSRDDCWNDYRFFLLLNIYRNVWWWDVGIDVDSWWGGLEKATVAVEDLNCMELLRS